MNPLRVVSPIRHESVHVRIHHSRAEDLDPADALAERISRAVRELARPPAAKAGDVHLDARLREREEPGAEPRLALGPEDRPRELVQGPLQVSEGDALDDRAALP